MRYKCQAFSLLLGALALALPAAARAQGDPRALPPDLASRLDPLLQRLQAPITPWGPLADADFSGLGAILEQGGVIKGTPPAPSELYTDSLLPGQ